MKHIHKGKHLDEIWHQVPPNYYQEGVKNNILQKMWHSEKLRYVKAAIRSASYHPNEILDAGAASGWFLSEIAKSFPKSKCTGVDIYEDAVAFAKKKYKNLNFLTADIHALPFKSNSFDVVICCEVLEHVVDPKKALLEMKRVLKRDGVLIVEIDTGNFLFKLVWFWWTTLRRGVWRDSHIHLFNIDILENLFRESGLRVEKRQLFNFTMAVVYTLRAK